VLLIVKSDASFPFLFNISGFCRLQNCSGALCVYLGVGKRRERQEPFGIVGAGRPLR
jgi:hypothetical protein